MRSAPRQPGQPAVVAVPSEPAPVVRREAEVAVPGKRRQVLLRRAGGRRRDLLPFPANYGLVVVRLCASDDLSDRVGRKCQTLL